MERSRLSLRAGSAAIAAILQDREISTEVLCDITGIRRAQNGPWSDPTHLPGDRLTGGGAPVGGARPADTHETRRYRPLRQSARENEFLRNETNLPSGGLREETYARRLDPVTCRDAEGKDIKKTPFESPGLSDW